jgi:hypothetical protein
VTYQTVGKTVLGKDIVIFKIGNPNGGRVLFDGAIHGNEAVGSELLYSYAEWLLESNDTMAKDILSKTYTLLIPVVNADEENSARKNADGVDLNRNFAFGWSRSGSYNADSDIYIGPTPLSEPESQTLVNVFNSFEPSFYVNLHMWLGPYYAGCRYAANATYYSMLVNEISALSKQRGVTPFPYDGQFTGYGMAIGDAARANITSFLIELTNDDIPLLEVQTNLLAKFIPVASVLSQEATPPIRQPAAAWDVNQDGVVNIQDLTIVLSGFGSITGSPNYNPTADVNTDGQIDVTDMVTVLEHFGE